MARLPGCLGFGRDPCPSSWYSGCRSVSGRPLRSAGVVPQAVTSSPEVAGHAAHPDPGRRRGRTSRGGEGRAIPITTLSPRSLRHGCTCSPSGTAHLSRRSSCPLTPPWSGPLRRGKLLAPRTSSAGLTPRRAAMPGACSGCSPGSLSACPSSVWCAPASCPVPTRAWSRRCS